MSNLESKFKEMWDDKNGEWNNVDYARNLRVRILELKEKLGPVMKDFEEWSSAVIARSPDENWDIGDDPDLNRVGYALRNVKDMLERSISNLDVFAIKEKNHIESQEGPA